LHRFRHIGAGDRFEAKRGEVPLGRDRQQIHRWQTQIMRQADGGGDEIASGALAPLLRGDGDGPRYCAVRIHL
jgi:hypothetical protein